MSGQRKALVNNRDRKTRLADAVSKSFTVLLPTKSASNHMPPLIQDSKKRPVNRFDSNRDKFSPHGASQSFVTPRRQTLGNSSTSFQPRALARAMVSSLSVSTGRQRQQSSHDIDTCIIGDEDDSSIGINNLVNYIPTMSPAQSSIANVNQPAMISSDWPSKPVDTPLRNIQRKKSKLGPLGNRLKLLRDSLKGDCIRFQSGQYPPNGRKSMQGIGRPTFGQDQNDPRRRASSHVDVTILIPSLALKKQLDRLIVSLGYIHCISQRNPTVELDLNNGMKKTGLAWIMFTHDTAREQNIMKGSELRVYNTVWIPILDHCRYLTKMPAGSSESMAMAAKTVCWLITCTQLCEHYPSTVLPALPNVENLVVQGNS
jgi:hypothetical protein